VLVKAAILLLAIVGITPAVLVSLWLVYIFFFVTPRHATQPELQHPSVTARLHYVQILQDKRLTLDAPMWLPIVVVVLGIGFLVAVTLLLYAW
jgi:hypothetical protein